MRWESCRVGQRTSDRLRRAPFARGDHNQQLHDTVIDLGAATLNNKDILVPNRDADIHTGFAIAEFSKFAFAGKCSKTLADRIREGRMRGAREYLNTAHSEVYG